MHQQHWAKSEMANLRCFLNEQTQQFGIDPDGADLGAVSIVSASGLLTGDDVIFPTEATLVEDLDNSVAFFLFPNNLLSDPFSLGRIAGERVSFDFLLSDLSLRFSPGLGIPDISSDLARGLIVGDRVVVPEPSSLLLVALAFASVAAGQRRKG